MPSVSVRGGVAAASCVVALTGLSACQTTQQTADLKAINSAREIADDTPVALKHSSGLLKVGATTLLQGKQGAVIAVSLTNPGTEPVNDLPISVGVTQGGKRMLLNEKPGSYFKNHAPAIPAGASTTWVFTNKGPLKKASAPFAFVGSPAKEPPTVAKTIPVLKVRQTSFEEGPDGPTIKAEVENTSGDPQYGLVVYAWAKKGNRYVAAGSSNVTDMSTDDTDTVTINLIGDVKDGSIELSAPATIFN